ncbi:uncharacterized protein IWZ02DRAFT_494186 [Phyllosticta citriasiana]|uniref:uncharacterized protein n=1 Tax=Phyllosticta citriasiana TaxID=595635 RepID=UPI0030FD6B3C
MDYSERKFCSVEGLADFASGNFQSKDYTDLTIRCKNKEFYVHKLIVRLKINVASKQTAHNSTSREARTGIVELHEDDLDDVQLLLDAFYSSTYDEHYHYCRRVYPDLPVTEASRLRDARLYAIAEKYQSPCAKKCAAQVFREELERETGFMKLSVSGFVAVAKKVFESTPDSDRIFRNLVDGFFGGLARFQTFYMLRMRMCPTCGKPQKNKFDDRIYRGGDMEMPCVDTTCNAWYTVDEWNRPYDTITGEGEMRSDLVDGPPHKRPRLDTNGLADEANQYMVGLGPSTSDEEEIA